jgi:exosome complex component RRP45
VLSLYRGKAFLQRDYALQALRSGVRVDGRALDSARTARIVLGPAHGQARVTLGLTIALTSVAANPVTLFPDRPAEDTLVVSVEISATASEPAALEFAVHGAHPPADKAARELRGLVERVIRDLRAMDTEALCILAGINVWAVPVDVALVGAAGNVCDTVHLAAIAALLHVRRNDVSISDTDVHVHPFSEREPLPLPMHHVPLIV